MDPVVASDELPPSRVVDASETVVVVRPEFELIGAVVVLVEWLSVASMEVETVVETAFGMVVVAVSAVVAETVVGAVIVASMVEEEESGIQLSVPQVVPGPHC